MSFSIAGVMIDTSVQDWSRNPVVTSIDTTAAPNSEVDFPAIRACRDMPSHLESWEIPTLVLDSIDFQQCSNDGCDKKIFNETKEAYEKFVGQLVNRHLETKDFTYEIHYEGSECPSSCTTNVNGSKQNVKKYEFQEYFIFLTEHQRISIQSSILWSCNQTWLRG